jgi:hypothetical protein
MAFKRVIIRRVGPLSWLLGGFSKKQKNAGSSQNFSALLRFTFPTPFPIRCLRHVTWLSLLSPRVSCSVTTLRFLVWQVTFSAQFGLRFAPTPHGFFGFSVATVAVPFLPGFTA